MYFLSGKFPLPAAVRRCHPGVTAAGAACQALTSYCTHPAWKAPSSTRWQQMHPAAAQPLGYRSERSVSDRSQIQPCSLPSRWHLRFSNNKKSDVPLDAYKCQKHLDLLFYTHFRELVIFCSKNFWEQIISNDHHHSKFPFNSKAQKTFVLPVLTCYLTSSCFWF